jgi:4-hydroxy-tetrahydrodipicolinate synthase
VPVVAGAGSNNTREAIELAQHAEQAGADGLLVVTPYYNKPTQKGLMAHYSAIAEAVSLPIIIYNIPGRSVIDMTPETMGALVKAYPNIVGVKDATGRIERVSEQRMTCGPSFVQLSGEDATALGFNAMAVLAVFPSRPMSRRGFAPNSSRPRLPAIMQRRSTIRTA